MQYTGGCHHLQAKDHRTLVPLYAGAVVALLALSSLRQRLLHGSLPLEIMHNTTIPPCPYEVDMLLRLLQWNATLSESRKQGGMLWI
jgi:hypothetical protein